jgi:hypothetical protein
MQVQAVVVLVLQVGPVKFRRWRNWYIYYYNFGLQQVDPGVGQYITAEKLPSALRGGGGGGNSGFGIRSLAVVVQVVL